MESVAVQTTARIVLHHQRKSITYLAHVRQSVERFLDHAFKWNLETATEAGHVLLLDRLIVNEYPGLTGRFREARFLDNIRTAAKQGFLDVLKWWRTKYMPDGPDVAAIILHNAAVNGHLHVIQWLFEVDGRAKSIDAMVCKVICSRPEVVYWMHQHQRHVKLSVYLDEAAGRGDLEFLKWVKFHGYEFTVYSESIERAAEGGHLDVLKFLERHTLASIARVAFRPAARYGHVHIVEWLAKEKNLEDLIWFNPLHDLVFDDQVIRWIEDHVQWSTQIRKGQWIFKVMKLAAKKGKLNILKHLYQNLPAKELEPDILCYGVRSGKLDIVQWLYDQGARCNDEDVFSLALRSGKLEMVQWIYENCRDVSVTTKDMNHAATVDLEMVQWLHGKWPESFTFEGMNEAAACGHVDIVQWFCNTRCVAPVQAMDAAASHGRLAVMMFLREFCSEIELGGSITSAAKNGHLNAIQWLYENGARDPEGINNALHSAIQNNHVAVVAYLELHCGAICPIVDVRHAMKLNRFHLLEWLIRYWPNLVSVDTDHNWPQSRFMLSFHYSPGLRMGPSNTDYYSDSDE